MTSNGDLVTALTADRLEALEREYERLQPFAGVEATMFETMSAAVRAGDLHWRDVEWMVRWYYRRHLSSSVNEERERTESNFRANEWPIVKETIESTVTQSSPGERVSTIATLEGLDVGVASAVLYFIDPVQDIVMAAPEWEIMTTVTDLEAFPSDPGPSDYTRYRQHCQQLATERKVNFRTLQRALWQLATRE